MAKPIAVSLKYRGLSVFDSPPLSSGWAQLRERVALSFVDLGVSIATNVVLLSWTTWFSVILTVLSTCFYAFFQNGRVARPDGSLLIPIAFLIYLPTLWLAYMTTSRRLEAAAHLGNVQSHVIGMYVLHGGLSSCGAPQLLAGLDDAISDTMVHLQGYLAHPRALSTVHFSPFSLRAENLPINSNLFVLGRDIGQRLRRLQSCQRRLAAAVTALLEHCSSSSTATGHCTQQVLSLVHLLVGLGSATAALTTLKDARSPLLLRVMLRGGCVVVAPLLTGSWLAGLAGQPAAAVGMVFAIVIGSILQVLLMSLLTLSLLLEDPFDIGPAAAPDTISLLEFNHTLSYLTAPASAEEDPPAAQEDDLAGEHMQQQQVVQQPHEKYHQQIQGFMSQQPQHQQLDLQGSQQLQVPATHQQQQYAAGMSAAGAADAGGLAADGYSYEHEVAVAAAADGGAPGGAESRGWGYVGQQAVAVDGVPPEAEIVHSRGTRASRQRASPTLVVQQQQQQHGGGRDLPEISVSMPAGT